MSVNKYRYFSVMKNIDHIRNGDILYVKYIYVYWLSDGNFVILIENMMAGNVISELLTCKQNKLLL